MYSCPSYSTELKMRKRCSWADMYTSPSSKSDTRSCRHRTKHKTWSLLLVIIATSIIFSQYFFQSSHQDEMNKNLKKQKLESSAKRWCLIYSRLLPGSVIKKKKHQWKYLIKFGEMNGTFDLYLVFTQQSYIILSVWSAGCSFLSNYFILSPISALSASSRLYNIHNEEIYFWHHVYLAPWHHYHCCITVRGTGALNTNRHTHSPASGFSLTSCSGGKQLRQQTVRSWIITREVSRFRPVWPRGSAAHRGSHSAQLTC